MKNRWEISKQPSSSESDLLDMRVYSSRLLGEEADLVLHGGGNTSVKGKIENVFGEEQEVLFVKGSGWDLRTIQAPGFPPTDLDYLQGLGNLPQLSDSDMMKHLRLALLDPKAPTPSVEAILHALIPHRFVDHTHADAVVAMSNSPKGERLLGELYGDEVLILPYIMPGFVLAKQIAAATQGIDWNRLKGIVLQHHGIFTFAQDAQASYDMMIELVTKAESFLNSQKPLESLAAGQYVMTDADARAMSKLRRCAGNVFGAPVLLNFDTSSQAAGFAQLEDCFDLATRGPLTPDHTLHTKAFAATFDNDLEQGLQLFVEKYSAYYNDFAQPEHQCLDKMPRYGVWKNKGLLYFAPTKAKSNIIRDIISHTLKSIQQREALGGWATLPVQDLFDVEYWELEQAKLKVDSRSPEFTGKVAVVTGASSGIGAACAELLLSQGAAVVGLDIDEGFAKQESPANYIKLQCDVTASAAIQSALLVAVQEFGGIDLLVSNAGNFPSSCTLEEMHDELWETSISVNLNSHMKVLRGCSPFLKNGFDPAVVFVGSKNVPAPGPGAGAYSSAKAGLAQLARVAALELGQSGIRVNTVHPNAVYDTALWTDELLATRAEHYGLSIAEYKANNLLKTEVTSKDVAQGVIQLLGKSFSNTTGAQIPIDGGNERVI